MTRRVIRSRTVASVLALMIATVGLWWSLAGGEGRDTIAPATAGAVAPGDVTRLDSLPSRSDAFQGRREVEVVASTDSRSLKSEEPFIAKRRTVGRVLDPYGASIRGAEIVELDDYQRPEVVATSADDGTFVVRTSEGEARSFVARHPDWVPSKHGVVAPFADQTSLTLHLRHGGRIEGRVVDDGGNPVVARVLPILSTWQSGYETSPPPIETDAQGRFALDAVLPGVIQLVAHSSGQHSSERRVAPASRSVRVTEQGVHAVQLVCLRDDPVVVHGRVLGSAGPRSNVAVRFFCLDGPAVDRKAVSGSDGSYEVEVPRPGDYAIKVGAPPSGVVVRMPNALGATHFLRIPSGEASVAHDIVVAMGTVTGRVLRADGSPARGFPLMLVREDALLTPGSSPAMGMFDEQFRFEDVVPGTYRLTMRVWGGGGQEAGSFGPFEVVGDRLTDLGELRLRPASTALVDVRDTLGQQVFGASIGVFDPMGRPYTSYPTGVFVGPGDYRAFGPLGEASYVMAWTNDGRASPIVAFEPSSDRDAVIELTVTPAARLVVEPTKSGHIVAAAVQVYDAAGVRLSQLLWSGTLGQTLEEPGVFFHPLAPGTYRIVALTPTGAEIERTVTIEPGEVEVRLELPLD